MLYLTFHLLELYWRVFHLFLSLIAGFLLFNSYFLEMLLFILDSSHISSLLISSPLDCLQSYLFLSLASSFFFIFLPLLTLHSFLFLRPSFPGVGAGGAFILFILHFLAWGLTSTVLPFLLYILLSPYQNLEISNILYWVPSLQGVLSFFFFLLSFSLFCIFTPLFIIIIVYNQCKDQVKRQLKWKSLFRSRLYLLFALLLLLSFLTPPDLLSLLFFSFPLIFLLESTSFVILLLLAYYNYTSAANQSLLGGNTSFGEPPAPLRGAPPTADKGKVD